MSRWVSNQLGRILTSRAAGVDQGWFYYTPALTCSPDLLKEHILQTSTACEVHGQYIRFHISVADICSCTYLKTQGCLLVDASVRFSSAVQSEEAG